MMRNRLRTTVSPGCSFNAETSISTSFVRFRMTGVETLVWTPPENVKRLRDALQAVQSDPAYQARLKQQGATAGEFGPDALAKLIRSDSEKWGAIIKAANIKME